jgi:hypothetical protein
VSPPAENPFDIVMDHEPSTPETPVQTNLLDNHDGSDAGLSSSNFNTGKQNKKKNSSLQAVLETTKDMNKSMMNLMKRQYKNYQKENNKRHRKSMKILESLVKLEYLKANQSIPNFDDSEAEETSSDEEFVYLSE